MRSILKPVYRHLVVIALVVLLGALAAGPFLARPGLPQATDAELHIYRAAQLRQALMGGAGYVRWAPDLWYGYGYPIFNYYAPLTYYLANALALPGADVVFGVKAVFVLGLLGAALGMWVMVREHWGDRAGIVAAAAFVFAPYIALVDPHLRGDLAESFTFAVFPWLLWAWQPDRMMRQTPGGMRLAPRAIAGVVLWAALVMTHNLLAVILSVLLVAWVAWQVVMLRGEMGQVPFRLHMAALAGLAVLAAGLSAIFWLPMLVELRAVRLTVVGPGQFDFHNHFVAWQNLFGPTPPIDYGATAPHLRYNLGLAQWILALAAPVAILRTWRKGSGRRLLFFGLAGLALVLLMLSPSVWLWEHLPGMAYIQFPWRLLGPAASLLAVCAGAGIDGLTDRKWAAQAVGASALASILFLALPALYPPPWPRDFGPTGPRDIIAVEQQGRWLGTTSSGDWIPATVKAHPPASPDLIASYEQSAVDKFDHTALPPGATLQVMGHTPAGARFAVTSPQAFTAQVLTFQFPGWRAWVDGQPVPITPSDPFGFITFPVPAGTHDVRVEFGTTLPRTAGAVASLVSLAALAVLVYTSPLRGGGRAPQRGGAGEGHSQDQSPDNQNAIPWALLAVALLFGLAKLALVDPCPTCFRTTSPPGRVLPAQHTIDPARTPSNLAGEIDLLAFDLPVARVRPGGMLPLTLYWKARSSASKNYQTFVHLVGPRDKLRGQPLRDKLNPGEFPTTRWPLDRYVWDDYVTPETALRVQPDTPPGQYEIEVGLYTQADGIRARVLDVRGNPAGDSILLPLPIQVLPLD